MRRLFARSIGRFRSRVASAAWRAARELRPHVATGSRRSTSLDGVRARALRDAAVFRAGEARAHP